MIYSKKVYVTRVIIGHRVRCNSLISLRELPAAHNVPALLEIDDAKDDFITAEYKKAGARGEMSRYNYDAQKTGKGFK